MAIFGAIIALLAIVITVLLFLAQRNRKRLSYEILSCVPILSVSGEIEGKLKILFKGKSVKKVYLIIIKLTNDGNSPITSSDYERPIRFKFHNNAKVLTAEISETSSKSLLASVFNDDAGIYLEPVLLNSGDYIVVKFLASEFNPKEQFQIEGRIIGVRDIREKTENFLQTMVIVLIGVLISVVGLFLEIPAPPSPGRISPSELPGILIALFGYLVSLYAILRKRRYRRIVMALLHRSDV